MLQEVNSRFMKILFLFILWSQNEEIEMLKNPSTCIGMFQNIVRALQLFLRQYPELLLRELTH